MTLIADSFLAGSLLTLLIPVALLLALVVWYLMFLRRVPEPGEGEEAAAATATPAAASNPAPASNPAAAANPSPGGTAEARPGEG